MEKIFCKNCGTESKVEGALFCEKCGKRLEGENRIVKTEEEPVAEAPVVEEPVAEAPVVEEPVAEEPVAEAPVVEEPVAEAPVAEKPVVEEPKSENQKESRVTIILIAAVAFLGMLVITGIVILIMYFNHNLFEKINPWSDYNNVAEIDDVETDVDVYTDVDVDTDVEVETDVKVDADKNDDNNDKDGKKPEGDGEDNPDTKGEDNQNTDGTNEFVYGCDTYNRDLHNYGIYIGDMTWEEAQADVKERFGETAYLLQINSDREYEYICKMYENEFKNNILWIGARRENDKLVYKWTDQNGTLVGDNIISLNYWLENEPSFYDTSTNSEETCVDMFYSKSEGRFVMNDVPGNILEVAPSYSGKIGYIAEIE